jgi:phosphohistidine phosphatase
MTRTLALLRHAKSDWGDASLPDHDRPLAKRGRKAAELVGEHLRTAGPSPDLVLCSPARRTRQTVERMRLRGVEVRFVDRLYAASHEEILACVRDADPDSAAVLVVGHNPGLQDLAVELAGPDLGEQAVRLRERFPTGALAVFEIDGPWAALAPGRARLRSYTIPRELG